MNNAEKGTPEAIGSVPVCAACGSERVVTGAWACWNRESGLWELERKVDQARCLDCGDTKLLWLRPDQPPNCRVRDLNDAFRRQGLGRGTVLVTEGISAQGQDFVAKVVDAVQQFDTFGEDNDPWGEHDFGAIDMGDQKVFWKIDPYDLELRAHSPNAANPAVTHRVLTIMLASEY